MIQTSISTMPLVGVVLIVILEKAGNRNCSEIITSHIVFRAKMILT
jgi:hypothetical protein